MKILVVVILFIMWLVVFCIEKYVKTIKTKSFKDVRGNKTTINDYIHIKHKNSKSWRGEEFGEPFKYKIVDVDNHPYNSEQGTKVTIFLKGFANKNFELHDSSYDFLNADSIKVIGTK